MDVIEVVRFVEVFFYSDVGGVGLGCFGVLVSEMGVVIVRIRGLYFRFLM